MSSFVKASGGLAPNSADPGEEFPFLHTITVVDRVVSVDKPELVQNNIKTETVTLNLDSEWEGLSTVINIGNNKPVSVIWSGEPVVIPAELMTTVGSLDVSVVGYGDDGGIRAVTKKATSIFNVVASGFVEGDEAVPDPTTILGQLIQAADNANQAADRFNQASEDIEGIGPAVEKVQASEANAKQSETNAAASAESASQSASAASTSAEAARTSETNAADSATTASEASSAAKASETNAASSASAASQSASQAQSSATAAASSAQAASTSAEEAKTASDSATSSKDAAAQSASEASASASAAKASETNAASSASAAKVSETNAADSATAAREAVDGFGLEVGTTTTGEPGTDAAVEIEKTGTKYTASFTIPRGDVGPAGVNENVPLGTASGIVAQATDAYPALPRKVQVHGRTIENLWSAYDQATNVGVTLDTDDTGLITVTGNATTNAEVTFYRTIEANPGDTFTVKASVDTNNTNGKLKIQCANQNGSYFAIDASTTPKTFSIPEGNSGLSLYIRVPYDSSLPSGVRYRFYVTLVRGSEAPVAFTPSGVHTVEPTKLVAAGRNQWYPFLTEQYVKNGITVTQNSDASYTIDGENTENDNIYVLQKHSSSSKNFLSGETVTVSCWDAQGNNISDEISDRLYVQMTVYQKSGQTDVTTSSKYTGVIPNDYIGDRFQITIKPGASFDNLRIYPQAEFGDKATSWKSPIPKIETNLPSGISLADGDTLTIDRDGTTQIVHSEGEPTVLENVTLPELPAPTFNVYTTGGYVPPTVDVDYEQDVNLALDREIPHDATLVGNGTKSSPLGVGDLSSRYTPTTTTTALDTRVKALEMIDGTFINPISKSGDDADADSIAYGKIYRVDMHWKNIPERFIGGYLFYGTSGTAHFQLLFGYSDAGGEAVYIRQGWGSIVGYPWRKLVKETEYQALEARVQALEAKLAIQ